MFKISFFKAKPVKTVVVAKNKTKIYSFLDAESGTENSPCLLDHSPFHSMAFFFQFSTNILSTFKVLSGIHSIPCELL